MQLPSESTSFTSAGTIQADECTVSSGAEMDKAAAYARSILTQAELSSSISNVEDTNAEGLDSTCSPSQFTPSANYATPGKETMTTITLPTYNLPPTPDATPTRSLKRSYVDAFNGDTSATAPTKHQATSARYAPPSPSTCFTTPTKRNIFRNIPAFSVANKSIKTTASTALKCTDLLSPPIPMSPGLPIPPPATLQELQDELAKPLPSDVIPSPGASSPYGFREQGRQDFTSAEIVDQDESGTYDPNVSVWEGKDEVDGEETEGEDKQKDVELGQEDEVQFIKAIKRKRERAQSYSIHLSTIEYDRFLESLLKQVSFAQVDRDIASNRGKSVWRRVLKEMFRESIEEEY